MSGVCPIPNAIPLANAASAAPLEVNQEEEMQEEGGLAGLPTELLMAIFSQLSVRDQQNVSYVCKRFRAVSYSMEYVRVLKRAIKNALGNLIENVEPEVSLLQDLSIKIFKIFKIDQQDALEELNNILYRIFGLYTSWQNHIIYTLVDAWKNMDDEETILKLLEALYHHPRLSNANRLHLLGLANQGKILEHYQESLLALTPALSSPIPDGKILPMDTPHKRAEVAGKLDSAIVISKDNTFKLGELVAVDHRGNLIGGRQKLFYGIVRDIYDQAGNKLYHVYTHCHEGVWIDGLILSAGMIGKIPNPD